MSVGPSSTGVLPIEAGGIGEVCTSPNHQRRYLSTNKISDERDNNYWRIHQAKFPEDAAQLRQLHAAQYWKEYVSAELGDTLWVLTESTTPGNVVIVAWISIRQRGDRY